MPKSRKRKKANHDRRGRPTRGNPAAAAKDAAHAEAAEDPGSLADLVLETLDHIVVQARNGTPFGAEMIVSAYLGASWGVAELDRLKAVTDDIGDMLAAVPLDHPAAEAFVRILAELGPPDARTLTDEKLAALPPVVPGLPRQWVDAINRVELIDGLCATDGYGEHRDVLLQFGYPQPDGTYLDVHTISLLLDRNQHLVSHLVLTLGDEAMATARDMIGTEEGMIEVPFDAQQVSTEVAHLLELTDIGPDNDSSEVAFLTRFLLEGRLRALPAPRLIDIVDPADAWHPEACAALIEAFLDNPSVRGMLSGKSLPDEPVPREVAASIAEVCVRYSVNAGNGDPLRWSPTNVDLFLLEYLPLYRPTWHPDAEVFLPEVLEAWVTFVGRRDGKTDAQIDETCDAIVEDIEGH